MCRHPTIDGFNGYVLNSRPIFHSNEGTGLTCNSSTRFDLIPMIDYIVCDNNGTWKPSLPKCYGSFFFLVLHLMFISSSSSSSFSKMSFTRFRKKFNWILYG